MANPVDRLENQNTPSVYYTASLSPQVQGTEIVQVWQLTNYNSIKIRGNIDLALAPSGSVPSYASALRSTVAYNDTYAPQNFGKLILSSTVVSTLGRADLNAEATVQTLSFFSDNNPTGVLTLTSSIRSSANIERSSRFQTFVVHQIEQRDLGQTLSQENNEPYVEPDDIDKDPTLIITKRREALVIPADFVLASSAFSMDGVIEPMTIRSIADKTSIELPYIAKSVKGSLSVSNEKGQSILISDDQDLRQSGQNFDTAPFLDSAGTFGNIDQPGAFSDAQEVLVAFFDASRIEGAFPGSALDDQIKNLFLSGVVSGSSLYLPPDIEYFPTYQVTARHGFVFSQNENYSYDSIAFGGLKK